MKLGGVFGGKSVLKNICNAEQDDSAKWELTIPFRQKWETVLRPRALDVCGYINSRIF